MATGIVIVLLFCFMVGVFVFAGRNAQNQKPAQEPHKSPVVIDCNPETPTASPVKPKDYLPPGPWVPKPGAASVEYRYKCPWCGMFYNVRSSHEEWLNFAHTTPCVGCGKDLHGASKVTVQWTWEDKAPRSPMRDTHHQSYYTWVPTSKWQRERHPEELWEKENYRVSDHCKDYWKATGLPFEVYQDSLSIWGCGDIYINRTLNEVFP